MRSNMETMNQEEQGTLDLFALISKIWKSFRKLWPLVLLLVLLGGGKAYFDAYRSYVPMYKSEAMLSVAINDRKNSYSDYYDTAAAQRAVDLFPYVLSSEVMNERLRAELPNGIQGSISSSIILESNLMVLSVNGRSAQGVYDTIQAVLTVYPQVSEMVLCDVQLIIVQQPNLPAAPYNNFNWQNSVKSGIIKGALIGIILVVGAAMMRSTVTRAEDVKHIATMECLARVPMVTVKRRRSKTRLTLLINRPKVDPTFREAFRQLRVRLLRQMPRPEEKVILFTSSLPSEGKTTVAANLAVALAKDGKRVLLMDGDLRNPSIKRSLGLKTASVGLGECLSNTSKEITFHRFEDTSLYLFAGEKAIANPTSLLQHNKLAGIFQTLRPMFDYIIVDTPPTCMMADASALCRHADLAVYVIREDFASHNQIRDRKSVV